MALVVYDPHPHITLLRSLLGLDSIDELTEEDDQLYLNSLDALDCKNQDHYAVLGLKKLRYLAGPEDIRRAYRKRILNHHPDKRRFKGLDVKDSHDYYPCITYAYEVLGDAQRRLAYDSIDPHLPDPEPPTVDQLKTSFFSSLSPFLHHKARESYDTCRDYSYFDESKDNVEDRESRRYIDKENRAKRARLRADEVRLVRQLIELAYKHDPRILAANLAAKQAKESKKQAKLDAARARQQAIDEAEKRRREAQEAIRKASEERRREEADRQRKQREADKMELKRQRRRLRQTVDKLELESNAPNRAIFLADMDLICRQLSSTKLQELNDQMDQVSLASDALSTLSSKAISVKQDLESARARPVDKLTNSTDQTGDGNSTAWTPEMIKVLIKAVNILPAGTPKRWEAVAAYIANHISECCSLTGKDVLKKAKELKHDDLSLKNEANVKAFDSFSNSVRETGAVKNVVITDKIEAEASRPWSIDEQRLLEQAMRTYPAGTGTKDHSQDRWQCIADAVGSRTRRECMLRCKLLSEQIRAKKAALASVAAKSKS